MPSHYESVPYPFLDSGLLHSGSLSESFNLATVETGLQELLSPETGSGTTFICRYYRSKTPPMTPDSTPEGSVIIIDLEQKAIQSARAKKGRRRESTSSSNTPDGTLDNESPQGADRPLDVDDITEDPVIVDSGVGSEPERISEILGRQLNAVITQAGWPRLRIERLLDAQQLLLVLTSLSGQLPRNERDEEWILIDSDIPTIRRLEGSELCSAL